MEVVAHRIFVQFLFYLQGVDLSLCSSVKTCCVAEAFIQVEVVMQVFRHAMPHCCLSQHNKLGSTVAAGLEGAFLSIQGFSHSSLCHFVKSCMGAPLHVVSR